MPIPQPPRPGRWLNRTVVGAGVTSFLADAGYEMATAVVSPFLILLVGAGAPVALGLIEGSADLLSNTVKLGSGWLGDRLGRRKPFVVLGYGLSGCANALWSLAAGWPMVFAGKLIGWLGKGIRGPLRNAILADSVAAADRGKAFGLHRAADTAGAVAGPLIGAALLWSLSPRFATNSDEPFRWIFVATLVPGLSAALAFALLVREQPPTGAKPTSLATAWRRLPNGFRRFLVGVGVFGLGDFSRTFLVLAVVDLFRTKDATLAEGAIWGAVLYAWHNAWQALAAYPVGHLSDHIGRRGLLVGSYALGAIVSAGLAAAFWSQTAALPIFLILFAASGAYIAVEDALESAMTADLVTDPAVRGTAFGVLGAVNGIGDFAASLLVGVLWQYVGAPAGLTAAAGLMGVGAVLLWRYR